MESNPTFFCGVTLTSMSARTTEPDSLTISWLSTALYLRIVPFFSYFAIVFLTDATFSPVNFAISAGLIRASLDNISNISSINDSFFEFFLATKISGLLDPCFLSPAALRIRAIAPQKEEHWRPREKSLVPSPAALFFAEAVPCALPSDGCSARPAPADPPGLVPSWQTPATL